jgi:ArsR family transcriptional regulator, lead/cadmium/zinc/bismuth-responsive transcriptional repressor
MIAAPTADALAETFRVLGDATRVRILDAISQSERCVCDIATIVGHSESAVSHQLRLLRGMRLVRPRREGRQVFYALDDHHIVDLFEQGLEHVQERVGSGFSRIGPTRSARVGSRASRIRTGPAGKRTAVRGRRS